MIHGPSLVIGASIAAITLIVVFFALGNLGTEKELEIGPTPALQEEGSDKITMAVFLENSSPYLGDPNAPITLVEFGDYQCHFCNVFFHDTKDKIVKNYIETGKVKMIFKDFTIIGPDSINAAHGAHCANDQGLFWEYHDTLYNNWTGENNGWASSENLLKFAGQIELDIEKWSDCMINSEHSEKITASNQDARSLGLTGTPSFFVIDSNNKVTKMFGAQPYEQFQRIFDT